MSDHVNGISRTSALIPTPESIVSSWRAHLDSWWNYTSTLSASYSQLPQNQDGDQLDQLDPDMETLRLSKARWRTYWLAVVLCCGGALFGYDSGVIGTVLSNLMHQLTLC
jgi:hypothetical protein